MTMEWDPFLSWELRQPPRATAGAPTGHPLTSDLDLWLVQQAYEVIAHASQCQACGARLGRSLRVSPVASPHPAMHGRLSVATRCTGWKRHRHHADAVVGADLVFGVFSRRGPHASPAAR
jgi:hypothetical protein